MATLEFISKQDLEDFKKELFSEPRRIGQGTPSKKTPYQQWIKSYEVRELLGIFPGMLQNLRKSGKIKFTKIGGLMFYGYEDVEKMMAGK